MPCVRRDAMGRSGDVAVPVERHAEALPARSCEWGAGRCNQLVTHLVHARRHREQCVARPRDLHGLLQHEAHTPAQQATTTSPSTAAAAAALVNTPWHHKRPAARKQPQLRGQPLRVSLLRRAQRQLHFRLLVRRRRC